MHFEQVHLEDQKPVLLPWQMACSALLITTCFGKLQLLIFRCLAPKGGIMSPYSNFPAEYMRTFAKMVVQSEIEAHTTDVPAPRDWRED